MEEELMDEVHSCKCGGSPEVFIRIRLNEPKYQGEVQCYSCGETVRGVCWCWKKSDAADDAIEEWNKVMPEVEDDR